jgi:hypothetical protein
MRGRLEALRARCMPRRLGGGSASVGATHVHRFGDITIGLVSVTVDVEKRRKGTGGPPEGTSLAPTFALADTPRGRSKWLRRLG